MLEEDCEEITSGAAEEAEKGAKETALLTGDAAELKVNDRGFVLNDDEEGKEAEIVSRSSAIDSAEE